MENSSAGNCQPSDDDTEEFMAAVFVLLIKCLMLQKLSFKFLCDPFPKEKLKAMRWLKLLPSLSALIFSSRPLNVAVPVENRSLGFFHSKNDGNE